MVYGGGVRVSVRKSTEWPWWLRDIQAAVGPIVSGRVYVVGGRPSCGKTLLLMNLMWQLARKMEGEPVMLTAWTERAREAALISIASLIDGYNEDLCLREKWSELPEGAESKVRERVGHFQEAEECFPFLDTACPTPNDISDALNQHEPTVFILDYLQKVRPLRGQSMFDAWHAVMSHCTQYAADGGTVFVGSQLKRKGDGVYDKYRPPFMEDFKGGGGIEEGANLALGLYRPLNRMTAKDEREVRAGRQDLENWKQHGIMAIKVLKHSFSATAADRIIRVCVEDNRRVVNYYRDEPPLDAGDAWEPDEQRFPF